MGSEGQQQGYQKLVAWQKADDLAVEIYHLARALPREERWLANQMCRAAVSVPANIAEGYDRKSPKEYIQALFTARGSLAEVEYYIHFSGRVHLIDDHKRMALDELRKEAARLLFLLIKALRTKYGTQRGGGELRESSPNYGQPDELDSWNDDPLDPLTP